MQSPYRDWSLNQRIDRVLKDEEFKSHCQRLRKCNTFDKDFKFVEKLSKIDVSNITCDNSLFIKQFSLNEIKEAVVGFYKTLDKICPEGISFYDKLLENAEYFTTETKTDNKRSHCCAFVKDGNVIKEIFLKLENEICTPQNAIHEFGHSFCEFFTSLQNVKDKRVIEIPTVILDQLSLIYLKEKFPDLKENYVEFQKYSQIVNVGKARECLAGALIIKVMTGEETVESVTEKYSDLFKQYPYIIYDWLEKIETFNFNDIMFEKKYLVPQAIAMEMVERYKNNPKLVVKQLKEIIAKTHSLTQEEVLNYLDLPQEEKLMNEYVSKFDKRIQAFEKERKNLLNKPLKEKAYVES